MRFLHKSYALQSKVIRLRIHDLIHEENIVKT